MHSPLETTDMLNKPTLSRDHQPARGTKQVAEPLSQMVAEYSSSVASSEAARGKLTSAVSRLKGALAREKVDMHDYQAYREDKHS